LRRVATSTPSISAAFPIFTSAIKAQQISTDYKRQFLPPKSEAKARHAEWAAEVETRIATLRAQRNGEGQPLTLLDAIALAGQR
jgi:hypothetical protein